MYACLGIAPISSARVFHVDCNRASIRASSAAASFGHFDRSIPYAEARAIRRSMSGVVSFSNFFSSTALRDLITGASSGIYGLPPIDLPASSSAKCWTSCIASLIVLTGFFSHSLSPSSM